MVKKVETKAENPSASASDIPAGLFDSSVAQTIKDSAQQIWLAGLGAYSKAQGEGGKVFDKLIKEGASLQRKTRGMAEERISEVGSKMSEMAGEVSAKAGQQWDKLESIFEDRVAKSLKRLDVPKASDVAALLKRIDALSAAVAKLSTPVKPPAAKKAAAKLVATKQAVAGKRAAPVKKVAAKRPARKTVA